MVENLPSPRAPHPLPPPPPLRLTCGECGPVLRTAGKHVPRAAACLSQDASRAPAARAPVPCPSRRRNRPLSTLSTIFSRVTRLEWVALCCGRRADGLGSVPAATQGGLLHLVERADEVGRGAIPHCRVARAQEGQQEDDHEHCPEHLGRRPHGQQLETRCQRTARHSPMVRGGGGGGRGGGARLQRACGGAGAGGAP